jgi:NAD(P)-dependent dehydrogenase (short-subunit alcohol dehydrogenase family)
MTQVAVITGAASGIGRVLRELAEPALDPATAAAAGNGAGAYAHLPNFLVVAAVMLSHPPLARMARW